MLSKFYKITSLEKKIFYTGFQQATRLSFIGFSSRWKYRLGVLWVAGISPASRGGGVSMDVISLPLLASDVNLDVRPFDSWIQQGVAIINLPNVEIISIVCEIPPVEVRRSQRTRRPAISND